MMSIVFTYNTPIFLFGGGIANAVESLPGYIKDVWPSLIILTTNGPLDHLSLRKKDCLHPLQWELQGISHYTALPPPQVTTRKDSLGHLTQRLRCKTGKAYVLFSSHRNIVYTFCHFRMDMPRYAQLSYRQVCYCR